MMDENVNLKSLGDIVSSCVSRKDGECDAFIFSHFVYENVSTAQQRLSYRDLAECLKHDISSMCGEHKSNRLIALYSYQWDANFYKILLGSIYSNYAFFVIDPQWPVDYIATLISRIDPEYLIVSLGLLQNSNSSWLISRYRLLANQKLEEYGFELRTCDSSAVFDNDLAYVIATSGTTGLPKIVQVCHSSVLPNILQLSYVFGLNSQSVVYQASPFTFDPSMIELFCSLYSGSRLVVLPQAIKLQLNKLTDLLIELDVDTLQITPSLLRNLANRICDISSLRVLALGGEAFPKDSIHIRSLISQGVKVYNIYGITELSVWSSIHCVGLEDLRDPNGIPIGFPLNQTQFFVKVDEGMVLVNKLISSGTTGTLFHSSETRKCIVNGETKEFVNSGDEVLIVNNSIYFRHRTNKLSFKINGKLVDLSLLEKTINQIDWVETTLIICHENALVAFVSTKSNKLVESAVRKHILANLPAHYEPRKVVILGPDESWPITSHGKLNTIKLVEKYLTSDSHENLSGDSIDFRQALYDVWNEILGSEPVTCEANFIQSGGDSLKALLFLDKIESKLKDSSSNMLLDFILNKTILDIELHIRNQENASQSAQPKTKKLRVSALSNLGENNQNVWCLQKNGEKFICTLAGYQASIEQLNIRQCWRVDTSKCVDATPLVLIQENTLLVLIGSHSKRFFCINGESGHVIWTYDSQDRIESSACPSKCGRFVIFGSYDKHVYVIEIESGQLYWKVATGDVVKSSPNLDLITGYVYIGSHDQHVYCLDIQNKAVVWKTNLDNASIFSSPVPASDYLFVTTLGGSVFLVDKLNGQVSDKLVLDKPVFTTPVLDDTGKIYIGTCGGVFYAINELNGRLILVWEFRAGGPIFSQCLVDEEQSLVAFGCHDSFIYCLNKHDGSLKWRFNCSSEIYGSPIKFYNSSLLCVSSEGVLFAFERETGRKLIEKKLFGLVGQKCCFSSPLVLNDSLYIGCRDDFIYCFKF